MKVNRKEILNGSILLLFGGWIWWQTTSFPSLPEGYPGPALFPRLVSIGLILSGLALLISPDKISLVSEIRMGANKPGLIRLGVGIAAVACYPLLQPYLGFAPTLAIICFGIALLLGIRIWIAALSSVGTVLFIFLTFEKLLGVSL